MVSVTLQFPRLQCIQNVHLKPYEMLITICRSYLICLGLQHCNSILPMPIRPEVEKKALISIARVTKLELLAKELTSCSGYTQSSQGCQLQVQLPACRLLLCRNSKKAWLTVSHAFFSTTSSAASRSAGWNVNTLFEPESNQRSERCEFQVHAVAMPEYDDHGQML